MYYRDFSGHGAINALGEILNGLDARRVMLITGKDSFASSGAKDIVMPLLEGLDVQHFFDFDANPKFEHAIAGARLAREFVPDIVVAIGGGSVIDMAKLINTFASTPNVEADEVISNTLVTVAAPLVAVPTTAGTGSEATHFAVVYIDGKKFSLAHQAMRPDIVLIDPELAFSMPDYLAASSAIDALAQAIESYWSLGSTKESRSYSSMAITGLIGAIVPAVRDRSESAIASLCFAANYAGRAINISKTTAPHALSYSISQEVGLAHGHAVGTTLGHFFLLHDDAELIASLSPSVAENLNIRMNEIYILLGCESGKACFEWWSELMGAVGLEADLSVLAPDIEDKIDLIVSSVNIERLNNHPMTLTPAELRRVLTF